ncbi:MAG: hypothetical protein JWN20_1135, partial [Jatrophihabitantaceae bacterium]|nr:hypothetical protein [Jatrophihabitantaceae bacterium]
MSILTVRPQAYQDPGPIPSDDWAPGPGPAAPTVESPPATEPH